MRSGTTSLNLKAVDTLWVATLQPGNRSGRSVIHRARTSVTVIQLIHRLILESTFVERPLPPRPDVFDERCGGAPPLALRPLGILLLDGEEGRQTRSPRSLAEELRLFAWA
jgi:hypothetical protein